MADEPREKGQGWEGVVREAHGISPPETVVFVPPKPVWQPFRLPEAMSPPRVKWQPSRRPEYEWDEPGRD